jgi:hypothetical protein
VQDGDGVVLPAVGAGDAAGEEDGGTVHGLRPVVVRGLEVQGLSRRPTRGGIDVVG